MFPRDQLHDTSRFAEWWLPWFQRFSCCMESRRRRRASELFKHWSEILNRDSQHRSGFEWSFSFRFSPKPPELYFYTRIKYASRSFSSYNIHRRSWWWVDFLYEKLIISNLQNSWKHSSYLKPLNLKLYFSCHFQFYFHRSHWSCIYSRPYS